MNIRLFTIISATAMIAATCAMSPAYASTPIFNTDVIQNGGFENVATLMDDWDCYYKYELYSMQCLVNSSYDEKQKEGEYYFRIGTAATTGGNVYVRIGQEAYIPEQTSKAVLRFDYQWHTLDEKGEKGKDTFNAIVQIYDPVNYSIIEKNIVALDNTTQQKKWKTASINLSKHAGKYIYITFESTNTNKLASTAFVDNVRLRAKTRSSIVGSLKQANGKIAAGKTVRVRGPKGKTVWKGKTNKNGLFFARNLKGKKKKYTVVVNASGNTDRFKKRVKWGKAYKPTYTLSGVE